MSHAPRRSARLAKDVAKVVQDVIAPATHHKKRSPFKRRPRAGKTYPRTVHFNRIDKRTGRPAFAIFNEPYRSPSKARTYVARQYKHGKALKHPRIRTKVFNLRTGKLRKRFQPLVNQVKRAAGRVHHPVEIVAL